MPPRTVPYDSNGDYIRNPNGDVNIINPIRELDYNTNQRCTFRANASMHARLISENMNRWKVFRTDSSSILNSNTIR